MTRLHRWVQWEYASRAAMAVTLKRRVDFPMVDLAGIMYYPVYWDMAHRFFEESWLEICGQDYPSLIENQRIGFPVVSNQADFLAPFRHGEEITCDLWIEAVGETSVTWAFRFSGDDGQTRWKASVVTVCMDMDSLEKRAIPSDLSAALDCCRAEEGRS